MCIRDRLDTDRARIMQADGSYIRFRDQTPDEQRVDSQIALMQAALQASEKIRQGSINVNRYEPLSGT